MGRRLKTRLPASKMLLRLRAENTKHVHSKLKARQHDQKMYHDMHAGNQLPSLHPGDQVRVQLNLNDCYWYPAIVKEKADKPRSYIVETPNGKTYRRNRVDIRLSKEDSSQFEPQTNAGDIDYEPVCEPELPTALPDELNVGVQARPQVHTPVTDNTCTYRTKSGRAVVKPLRYRSDT